MAAAGSGIVDERALPVRRDADAELAAHLRIKNALDAPQAGPSSDEPSAAGSANITCPEGSYWALLQDVWRSGLPVQADDRPDDWRGCTVCDVAFFTQGFVRAWYFTARDGTLRKKRMKNLGVQELVAAFGAGKSVGLEEEVVALGIFGPTGIMDAAGRVGSTVAPLERATLRWLLDRRDSSRRKQLHAVLRYVRPRGERESVLRFDWRAQVTSYELRSSMAPLKSASTASIVPAHVRLATHGDTNLLHSCKEKHVPTAAVREAAQVCATLAERVQPGVPRERVRVCADFKLLGGSKVVLLWAATPPPEAAFPSPEFPSSMPCASMPAEATQRARLASPRFVMRAHAGWHLAGMCHDCAARCAVANAAAEWRGNDMASSPPSSPRTKAEGATATTGRRGPGALKAMAARDLGSMRHLLLADGISTGGATAAPGDDSDAKSDAAPGPAEAAVVDATREDAAPAGPPTAEAEAPAGLAPTSAHQLKATPLWLQPYMRTSS